MIPISKLSAYTNFGNLNQTLNFLKQPDEVENKNFFNINQDVPIFQISKIVISDVLDQYIENSSFSISKPYISERYIFGYNEFNSFLRNSFKFLRQINIQAACATGIYSIFAGYRYFYPDKFIAGAAEYTNAKIYISAFNNMGCLSKKAKPFDRFRRGFHIGYGAGAFIISEVDPIATLKIAVLNDNSGNTYSFTDNSSKLISKLIENVTIEKPDFIQPHATATIKNDEVEIKALKDFFGSDLKEIPVVPLKQYIGHCLGASAAVELALSIAFAKSGFIPGYKVEHPDDFMDGVYVPDKTVYSRFTSFLKLAYGFGGHLAACFVKICD